MTHARPHSFLPWAVLLLCACSSGEAARSGAVVDTLASGAVRVRSTAEGEWATSRTQPWKVVEELRIGRIDGAGPDVFGQVRNVIPDARGRIWLLDSQASELRLFDAEGRFVRSVGRAGNGPGEFGFNPCAFPGPDGEIWVEAGGRWQRFDTEGALVGGMQATSTLGCGIRRWTPDGRFLVVNVSTDPVTRERIATFAEHRLGPSGELIAGDTFPAPPLPTTPTVTWRAEGRVTMTSGLPFWPRATYSLAAPGDFWISDGGDSYSIRRQTLTGDTLLMMERPHEPIPIEDSIRDRAIREFRREGMTADGGFDPGRVPRVYPPFDVLHVATDGTLWVWRTLAGGIPGLDVFSADGRYLGAAEVSADLGKMFIHAITADAMYGIARDELDVQYVVRLGIVRPGG